MIRPISTSLAVLMALGVAAGGCSSEGHPSSSTSGGGNSSTTGGTSSASTTGTGGDMANASGGSSSGGNTAAGGSTSEGGSAGSGEAGASGSAGHASGGAAGSGGSGGSAATGCDAPGLVWKTGSKTNFTSYPDPGSEECIKYSGCMYEGQFAACNKTEPLVWVMSHNIVAVFPDLGALKLHDLCLKSGTKTIVVTALDTCGDSDCDGCCTKNKGTADELIDVESFTNDRWGVPDGKIQWADLGPTKGQGCQ